MSSSSGPLVGRGTELSILDRALDHLDEGKPGSVTVEGEPGIGKSRLLAELRARSEDRGHIVLAGSGSEFETFIPFGIAVDALDAYLASLEHEVADWPTDLKAELGRVFPSLGKSRGADTQTTGDERFRTHRAVRFLMERLAAEKPVVMILDDVHWADDATLELLQALLRRPPDARALLALGFRPSHAPTRLRAALAAPTLERISLRPLSRDEAAVLLSIDPGSPDLAAIYDRGEGNPFYLEQLARTGGGADATSAGSDEGAVPAGIVASVAEEVALLTPLARMMLESAAVAGDPFEPDIAAEIAGFTPDDGLVHLDELLAADLVRPTAVPRRFSFRHPLLRRAIYDSVQGGWRLAAHGRAAAALAARGASATVRAHHVEQAAGQGDEDAIGVLVEAGEASVVRAPVVACRWFEGALRLLPAADTPRQIGIRRQLAQSLRSSGRLEACRATLCEAIDLIPDPADPARIDLVSQCAAVERWLGRDRQAHERLGRARDQLPATDSGGRAALEIELAIDAVFARDLDRAIASGEIALAAADELGSRPLFAAAAAALALAEAGAGRIESARRHREAAVGAVEGLSDEELAPHLDALYHLGWAENYLENLEDSLTHVDRLIDIVRQGHGARPLVPMLLVKCYPLEALGRLREAADLCDMAIEATQLGDASHFLPWALFERGWAHYYMGELEAAVACAEQSMTISNREIGGAGPSAGIGPVWIVACATIQSGKPARAAELLAPFVGEDIEGALPVERAFFWETLALAEIGAGRPEKAVDYIERAEADAEATGLAIPTGVALRARAASRLSAGDPQQAAVLAGQSAEAFATIGARMEVAFSRNLQGKALAESGDRDGAVPVLRDAEAELDSAGSVRERDSARRLLRSLGARIEVRGPATGAESGIASLTDREREIADLVTNRHTNREIATRLYLSQKTVETHLRNVFIKLGASSRVEVARMIERSRQEGDSPSGAT
jgi:DNA-binding CsgD family transcriptional regulator/tetratricopeptide (TPR) repeat protein